MPEYLHKPLFNIMGETVTPLVLAHSLSILLITFLVLWLLLRFLIALFLPESRCLRIITASSGELLGDR